MSIKIFLHVSDTCHTVHPCRTFKMMYQRLVIPIVAVLYRQEAFIGWIYALFHYFISNSGKFSSLVIDLL